MNWHTRLSASFTQFAVDFDRAVPMYATLAREIGGDPELIDILGQAPPEQQFPVLLFAAVHALVLDEPSLALGEYYPSVTPNPRVGDVFSVFRSLCLDRREQLVSTVATRATQTNEVGRCRFYLPALSRLARETGPLSLVDVGASAGLNLFVDRFRYSYGHEFTLGPTSNVVLSGDFRGDVRPQTLTMPAVVGRLGIDRSPLVLSDRTDRTWLKACVWPEQLERFKRLEAAIDIAGSENFEIRRGDAVHELASAVHDARTAGHPVVMNSWVLNYLTPEHRLDYVNELDRLGSVADQSWVFAESPQLCDHLPFPADPVRPNSTLLMLVTWRSGVRTVRHLADCHPHGEWVHWIDEPVE